MTINENEAEVIIVNFFNVCHPEAFNTYMNI